MTDTETKKTIELSYEKAVELLDRAVEEKGEDYVYERLADDAEPGNETCAYFHGDEPGCIVGHVLAYAGLGRDDLRGRGGDGEADLNTYTGADELRGYGVLVAMPTTINLLAEAQAKQDNGLPWGQAVAEAKELAS